MPLAGMADSLHSRGIHAADLNIEEETQQRVAFSIRYGGDPIGAQAIIERYELTPEGLRITPSVEGGTLSRFVVPLLVTDGMAQSSIEQLANGFRVVYEGAVYETHINDTEGIEISLDATDRPNANGIYRLGVFDGDVAGRTFTLTIEQTG